jgi:FkbM family methyltransferase
MWMTTLSRAFLMHANHRFAGLPYNLNWGTKKTALASFLSKHHLSIMDVGARRAPIPELASLSTFIRYYGFDADKEECERLIAHPPSEFAEYRILPCLLDEERKTVAFHLYSLPGYSSVLEIDEEFNRSFLVPPIRLEKTVDLPAISLDEVLETERIEPPDMLKLDTQGSELSILRGGVRTLEGAGLLEIEVEFFPMYTGQPLFAEVDQFLRKAGFELLYLNRNFLQRKACYKGLARGQLMFADALYGRNISDVTASWSTERAAKYVVLLCHYGHIDFACQLCTARPDILERFPEIAACFPSAPGNLQRGLVSQLDKLSCLLLHCRRTNHLFGDSDRSWPIR